MTGQARTASFFEVPLNILARSQAPIPSTPIQTPESLQLKHVPLSDCARYDNLRTCVAEGAAHGAA